MAFNLPIAIERLPGLFPRARADVFPYALGACTRFSITTAPRFCAFIAQLAHESAQFTALLERFNYSPERLVVVFPRHFANRSDATAVRAHGQQAVANRVYANRMGNGVESLGNGWRYRGRGWIQLTGRSNYERAGAALGLDLLGDPDQVTRPAIAWLTAGWFWDDAALNILADAGSFEALTRRINGGLAGYPDRVVLWKTVKTAMSDLED